METYVGFETKADLVEYLNSLDHLTGDGKEWWDAGAYYLSHGEYARPTYKPRRYGKVWGIHRAVFYYPGTLFAPKDGRVEMGNNFVKEY